MIANKDLAAMRALMKSAGGGTGGGASIDVTAQVGQTIVVKEVDANGKPTAWESADYQPRTHWSEAVEVLAETTVAVDPDMGMALLPDLAIVGGDKCTVNYNGTEYVCECIDIGDGALGMGNLGMIDEENPVDTGEPFIIGKTNVDEDDMAWIVMPLDGSESPTLSIIGQIHHAIPDKYLPFKLVNVNFTVTADGTSWFVESDMSFSEVHTHAFLPNTIVRGVVNDGENLGIVDFARADDSVIHFNSFTCDISNRAIVVMDVRLFSDGRIAFEQYHVYSKYSE